jgi:hypothetical protein
MNTTQSSTPTKPQDKTATPASKTGKKSSVYLCIASSAVIFVIGLAYLLITSWMSYSSCYAGGSASRDQTCGVIILGVGILIFPLLALSVVLGIVIGNVINKSRNSKK